MVRVKGLVGSGLVLGVALMLAAVLTGRATGDAVFGEVFPLRQPDGAKMQVRVWGDEFYRVIETLDGYTLVRDPESGAACYARLSRDGNTLRSTGRRADLSAPPRRLPRHLRINQSEVMRVVQERRAHFAAGARARDVQPVTTGSVVGLCLIVDFSDDLGTIPPVNVANYCNQTGYTGYGNNGSVKDYFHDVSNGLLDYTNYVPVAYYRADEPKTCYNDPNVSYGERARELVIEALTDLDNSGFDFSQYDVNGDGFIDALNVFYAGYRPVNWAEGLWPHAWTVNFSADNVSTNRYQITDMRDELTLRTFCHENGHMLCFWPDLYDYDYDSTGVGQFCLMCYGTTSTNPGHPCAYMKDNAGWTNTVILHEPQMGIPAPADGQTVYKYPHNGHPNEYYMIENRQQAGRDAGLPDHGLAIWHIDENGNNSNNEQTPSSHFLVTLVQADGDWDLENNVNDGDSTDLYAAPNYYTFTPLTSPSTSWWDGSDSGLYLFGISTSSASMTFNFWGPAAACCTPDVGCTIITEGECTAAGGTWQGIGSTCDPYPCATLCPEDLQPPPGVEQQDLTAVLNRWGDPACLPGGAMYPCAEDLAAPAGVEQQDLTTVLNRWGDPSCLPGD